MHWIQIVIYALVQGITELFPISSVGHAVFLPAILNWQQISSSNNFLPFVVMLHLGTAAALIIYFWRDWVELIASLFRRDPVRRRLLLLIIVATIPAAIIGKLLEKEFRLLFPSALSAGIFLIVNGLILFWADRLRQRRTHQTLEQMTFVQSFVIGLVQAFALIPGFSRSGITMTAGLRAGLKYDEAARFSFLLATPVILGAGILELPKILKTHDATMIHFGIIGGLAAGVVALLSTAFLMRYFKTHEVRALRPFGYYCVIAGLIVVVLSALHIHL